MPVKSVCISTGATRAPGAGGVLSGDLEVASDGREAELRGDGTEVGASTGGAMEVGGTFRFTTCASGVISEYLGLAVEFLAANATPSL